MSMNLALKKGNDVDWQYLYQTPTKVTKAVLSSDNPLQAYKDWLKGERQGNFEQETKKHLEGLEYYIADGYKFIMI